ncbi:MAG TPA: hypothetical protein VH301_08905, partial [Usitatibacter sp.]|nr:hypothetical protein [Usitatibacter sp.]
MDTYRKEGTFEKSYTTLNGIAMLLLVLGLLVVEIGGFPAAGRAFVIPGIVIAVAILFIAG